MITFLPHPHFLLIPNLTMCIDVSGKAQVPEGGNLNPGIHVEKKGGTNNWAHPLACFSPLIQNEGEPIPLVD